MNVTCFTRLIGIFFLACVSFLAYGQDVILETQADVDAFDSSVTVVEGDLVIGSDGFEQNNIDDISSLSNVQSIEGQLLVRSTQLSDLNEFLNLDFVESNIYLFNNELLANIDGLIGLSSINGSLYVAHNDILSNVDGFSNIVEIEGYLRFEFNHLLVDFAGFSKLESVGEYFGISHNLGVKNLNGFQNLNNVGGFFELSFNPLLSNFNSLSNITSVSSFIVLEANASLQNVDGFSSLEIISDNLYIHNNQNLTNLDGLTNIESIFGNVEFSFNFSLSNCCGIQHLLEDPDAIDGAITIQNNPIECSSQEEILEVNCSVSINDLTELELTITPNVISAGDQLYIQSKVDIMGATIELRNTNGHSIMTETLVNSYIDLPENISPGLYYLSISMDGKVSTKKVMVVR